MQMQDGASAIPSLSRMKLHMIFQEQNTRRHSLRESHVSFVKGFERNIASEVLGTLRDAERHVIEHGLTGGLCDGPSAHRHILRHLVAPLL